MEENIKEFYTLDCGCQVPIIDKAVKTVDGLPSLEIDYYNLRHDCPLAWDVFKSGKTKGVFQLETPLGKKWSKQVAPDNLLEAAALISILRPGTLKALYEGKSMTQHFCDRKSGKDEAKPLHPTLVDILKETQQIIVYQENCLEIAKHIAGFNLQEADKLRKAIGTKDAKLLASIRDKFVDGCLKVGLVAKDDAVSIFDNIEKSNRYSFNKSHAVEYAEVGYWTAWTKAHFPLHFYSAWLTFAKEKIKPEEEVSALVQDAKANKINILTPTIKSVVPNFAIEGNNIRFGFGLVKGLGGANLEKLANIINSSVAKYNKPIHQFNTAEFMFLITPNINKTVMYNITMAGALDCFGLDRRRILYYYDVILGLTDKEIEQIIKLTDCKVSLIGSLKTLLEKGKINKPRRAKLESLLLSLENPPHSLNDTPAFKVNSEVEFLGCPISTSSLEACFVTGDTTVEDFNNGKNTKDMKISVEISDTREYIIRNGKSVGKPMLFVSAFDETGMMQCVAFSEVYQKYQNILLKGNTVLLHGNRSKEDSFTINKVVQL